MDLIEQAAAIIAEAIDEPHDRVQAFLEDGHWELHPFMREGEMQAFALVSGTEVHFGVVPAFRGKGIQRKRTAEFLKPLFDRLGYLTTRTAVGQDCSFIERIGFTKTWSDGEVDHHILTALPFQKKEN